MLRGCRAAHTAPAAAVCNNCQERPQTIFGKQGTAPVSPATPKIAAGPARKPSRRARRSVPAIFVNSSDSLLF